MTENTITLSLLPAPDDPRLSAHEYQNDLHEFYHSLQKASVGVSARMRFRDAIGAEASLLGTFFIPLAKVAIPTLGVVLVAWLKGRSGRRVRLECDGVKAEGGTLEEVETLLKRAAEFRDSQQKSDGDT